MTRFALLTLIVLAAAGWAGAREAEREGLETEATARIAFVRGSQLWVMNANGSGQRKLTRGHGSKSSPVWSPNGSKLAYAHDTQVVRNVGTPQEYTSYPSHIFVINADGSRGLRLTRTEKYAYEDKSSPKWSPDGRTIVFERYDDGDYWISVVTADGSGQRSLTRGWPPEDANPAWSPDGQKIAFTNVHDGSVYVMRPDGSGRRVLARRSGAGRAWDVAWSPDGRQIAFVSDDDLWVMQADGRRPRRLVASPGQQTYGIAWSPNGRRIAFSVLERGAPRRSPDADSEIFVVNADGSGLRNLSDTDRVLDVEPVWSPDGRAIAFTSDRDGNSEIYVMNSDGSDQRNVSQSPAEDFGAAWAPKD